MTPSELVALLDEIDRLNEAAAPPKWREIHTLTVGTPEHNLLIALRNNARLLTGKMRQLMDDLEEVTTQRDALAENEWNARNVANTLTELDTVATLTRERDTARAANYTLLMDARRSSLARDEAKVQTNTLTAEVARLRQELRDIPLELDRMGYEKASILMEKRIQTLLYPTSTEGESQ